MGQLHYFFGLEVQSTLDGLHLTQVKYIHDLFNKTRMIGATPMPTLCEGGLHLSKHDGQPLDNHTLYQRTVGALQYLTLTRLELTP